MLGWRVVVGMGSGVGGGVGGRWMGEWRNWQVHVGWYWRVKGGMARCLVLVGKGAMVEMRKMTGFGLVEVACNDRNGGMNSVQ